MKKKFFAMYALAGALVASPVFTSCVDDTVSPQVEAMRDANIKYKNAQTAQLEAKTAIDQANAALEQEAQRIANAHAAAENAHNEALQALYLAEQQYQAAKKEANRVMQEKKDSINFETEMLRALAGLENAKAEMEKAKTAVEKAQAQEAVAKAQAKYELEKAEMQAEIDLMSKKQNFISEQEKMNKVLAGLEEKAQKDAKQLNTNAKAIMLGGNATSITDGSNTYYNSSYGSSSYNGVSNNSIIALMQEIAKENANIIKYEAKLIDVEAYIKKNTAENNKKIELANALIANYKELQTANSYEAVVKKYEEAKKYVDVYQAKVATAAIEKQEAFEACNAYMEAETENDVLAYINKQLETYSYNSIPYMSHSPISSNDGIINEYVYEFNGVSQLDSDISDAESAVTTAKGNVTTRQNAYETTKQTIATTIESDEATLAIKKADLKKRQDALAALKAEADYVALVEAVATKQAAFVADPTPTTLDALNNAKQAVKDYTGTGTSTVSSLEDYLTKDCGETIGGESVGYEAYVANMEVKLAALKAIDEDAEVELYWMEENSTTITLADLEDTLAEKEEDLADLEALKEMFAEDSEAMVAYNEWVDGLKELIEAYDAIEDYSSELSTWESLKGSLESYVTSDTNNIGHFDYAALIKAQEQIIADAEKAIAKLPLQDENGSNYSDFNNGNGLTYDDIIKTTEAKIAALEAELEARQAEYDAIMKQLDELVKAETETEGAE